MAAVKVEIIIIVSNDYKHNGTKGMVQYKGSFIVLAPKVVPSRQNFMEQCTNIIQAPSITRSSITAARQDMSVKKDISIFAKTVC